MKNSLKKIMITIVMLFCSTAQVQSAGWFFGTDDSDKADTGDYKGPSEGDLDKKIASDFDKLVAQLNAEYEKSLAGQDLSSESIAESEICPVSNAIEMQDKKYINSVLVPDARLGSYLLLIAEYLHGITTKKNRIADYEMLYDWLSNKEILQTAKDAGISHITASIIPAKLLRITPADVIAAMKNDVAWNEAKSFILLEIAGVQASSDC